MTTLKLECFLSEFPSDYSTHSWTIKWSGLTHFSPVSHFYTT